MTSQIKWTFNDGWILMSVYLMHGPEGTSLPDLIAAADVMNHAIPTSDELTQALTRLAKCGVVRQVNGRYCIASNYLPALAAAKESKGGLFAIPDKGKKWLSSIDFEMDQTAQINVCKETVMSAFEQYRDAIKRS